jgi:hypothetical protein
MRGRPAQTLTKAEEAELARLLKRVEKAEGQFVDARAALVKAVRKFGKPEAVARALGVSRSAVDYWTRTPR